MSLEGVENRNRVAEEKLQPLPAATQVGVRFWQWHCQRLSVRTLGRSTWSGRRPQTARAPPTRYGSGDARGFHSSRLFLPRKRPRACWQCRGNVPPHSHTTRSRTPEYERRSSSTSPQLPTVSNLRAAAHPRHCLRRSPESRVWLSLIVVRTTHRRWQESHGGGMRSEEHTSELQ